MLGTSPPPRLRNEVARRKLTEHIRTQANFRRTNVATKLKITYLREQYLNVKIQYKACA